MLHYDLGKSPHQHGVDQVVLHPPDCDQSQNGRQIKHAEIGQESVLKISERLENRTCDGPDAVVNLRCNLSPHVQNSEHEEPGHDDFNEDHEGHKAQDHRNDHENGLSESHKGELTTAARSRKRAITPR